MPIRYTPQNLVEQTPPFVTCLMAGSRGFESMLITGNNIYGSGFDLKSGMYQSATVMKLPLDVLGLTELLGNQNHNALASV